MYKRQPLEEVTKFTSNESDDNLTIVYAIIGIVVAGIIAAIVIKRRR